MTTFLCSLSLVLKNTENSLPLGFILTLANLYEPLVRDG
jgi:hypothetical protein